LAARRRDSLPSAAERARIVRVGAEGDGVAIQPNGTRLYVPGTLPGEIVEARRTARRGNGWAAVAEVVLAPSAERMDPPCPHFGACGGCALQHWREAPYLAWKSDLLAAALRRAGYGEAAVAPIVATPSGARRRMDLAARREGATLRLGLHVARGREIVDLHACPVLHPALTALLAPLRALLAGLAGLRREGAVIANLLATGPDLLLRTDAPLTAADRARLADFARAHALPRIAWARGGDAPEIAAQLHPATVMLGGVPVAPPPGAFLQASPQGEAAIIAAVLAGLPNRLGPRARVVDLFAGCGTLTFPLAARARVAAFEGEAAAARALAEAANRAGLAGRVEVFRRDLARQRLTGAELSGFAAIVLDPPQAGAAAQVAEIATSGVARVIYVSCNPAALARDAGTLRAAGYRLLGATPIDQFRWSARLESVAVFAR
jgi:23S rRNA (uracil1939-C5)-methyltransferase